MKKINDSTFDIEMTTIRELNPDEVDQVGGGGTPGYIILTMLLSCFAACQEK